MSECAPATDSSDVQAASVRGSSRRHEAHANADAGPGEGSDGDPASRLPVDLDELPDGVVIADSAGTVVVVNAAGERLLGASRGALLGRPLADVLPLYDERGRDWWRCLAESALRLPTVTRMPERTLVRAGSARRTHDEDESLLVTARFVRDASGNVVRTVVSFRDAHTRLRHERERADLVSTVAHELRSPLTSVKGFTATLLSRWERFTDEQKRVMLQTVNADADRVTRLLAELLDVSRIDSGRLELRTQVVDLAAHVQKVFHAQMAAGEPADRFVLDVDGELPEMWLDPDKLDQVLANLVENAVRHGSGRVRVEIRPATLPPHQRPGAVVVVTDEGEGIAPALLPRVFAKFQRGPGGRGGTGLGLYVAKGLVEAHGGSIEAGNGADRGARFVVGLPAGSPPYEL